jgi:glucose/arabinose dehydrogenase
MPANPDHSPVFFQCFKFSVLCAIGVFLFSGCGWLQDRRDENKGIQLQSLKVPPGYRVAVLARDLPKARHLALGPRGTLFVGSTAGNVYALTLSGNTVGRQRTIIKGLADSGGIAFHEGHLYVADRTRILRIERAEDRLDDPAAPMLVMDGFPDKARHGSRVMGFGPDGKLYVSIGAPCDVCEAKNDEYGTILRSNPDGSGREVYARGIRNSVGFDWHPVTRELWFSENGQDALGPDRPNDELNRVTKVGEHFGFPYCHDTDIADPQFGVQRSCREFTAPVFGLGARVAALGMRFEGAARTPSDPSILIARHGSHPPSRVGYDVVRVVLQGGQPSRMEPFLTGFLEDKNYWGRPVDVLVMRDGSVLVSDDLNGAIYRVSRD